MIEHCISAFSQRQEEKAFWIYVTDALKVISENTAEGERRTAMAKRWFDVIEPPEEKKPEETRSAEEIITDLKKRLNRKEVKQ